MNITLYIAGCALIAYGLNKSTNALFIALAITGIFTFFLSKGFILPFLSVILFIISFLGELAYLSSSIQLLQIAVVPVLAVFLFTNLYERDILTGLKENLVSKYTPFHSGLFVSCICLLAGLSVNYGIPAPYWLLSIFIWSGSSYYSTYHAGNGSNEPSKSDRNMHSLYPYLPADNVRPISVG